MSYTNYVVPACRLWRDGVLSFSGRRVVSFSENETPPHKIILDSWQEAAIKSFHQGCHIVVDAPTTAGKTCIIEEIFHERIKTKNPGIHFFRGSCVVVANIAFFAGIAVLPLAEATAIFFISPILITFFSIIFLKEKVGILRWSALIFGLLGVILVIKPFGASFRWEIIFPFTAALAYSSLQILTRYLGVNEKAATMAFYI